jgi:hypothetical protein
MGLFVETVIFLKAQTDKVLRFPEIVLSKEGLYIVWKDLREAKP